MRRLPLPALPPALVVVPEGTTDPVPAFAADLEARGWNVDGGDLAIGAAGGAAPTLSSVGLAALADRLRQPPPGLVLLPPALPALWRWWGPHRLYRDLALGVASAPVRRLVVGLNWILVEGPAGAGLASTPRDLGNGCAPIDDAADDLAALASGLERADPLATAIGLAAAGAHYAPLAPAGDADADPDWPADAVVVGRFPGLPPDATVVERQPRPGEWPDHAADWLLAAARPAVITSSALVGRDAPRLLERAQGPVTLMGPSTPLTPRLFAYGVAALAGFRVEDAEGAARAVAAGASARGLRRFGRKVVLRASIGSGCARCRDEPSPG